MRNTEITRIEERGFMIPTKILYDNRLTSNSLRVLIWLLSDDDSSVSLRIASDTLGIAKGTVASAFKNLETLGYLERTKTNNGYHYSVYDEVTSN